MTKIKNDVLVVVMALRKAGLKPMEISRLTGQNYDTLRSHFKKSKLAEHLPPKIVKPKGYFQGRITGIIKRYIEENPCAKTEQVIAACGLQCHRTTLGRYLNKNGLGRTKAKRSIFLRDINRMKSLEFARFMIQKSDAELNSILWTDETMVKAFPNGKAVFFRANRNRSDIISPVVQQGGSGQMLWGCVSFHAYGPLIAVDGFINGDKYLELLKNVVRPELDASRGMGRVLMYQQDNARPHKTPEVLDYLANWGYEVIDWPPQSPDLSPIENFWNIIKMKMKAMDPRPRTTATMRNAMMNIWDELDADLLVQIVGTFRERLQLCIDANGGLIKKF